jgi:hypothetical protein
LCPADEHFRIVSFLSSASLASCNGPSLIVTCRYAIRPEISVKDFSWWHSGYLRARQVCHPARRDA